MNVGQDLIHVGFGNVLAVSRIIAVATPNSAPVNRSILAAREAGKIIDLTNGRKTKSVVFADNGSVILLALEPDTVRRRSAYGTVEKLMAPEESEVDTEEGGENGNKAGDAIEE